MKFNPVVPQCNVQANRMSTEYVRAMRLRMKAKAQVEPNAEDDWDDRPIFDIQHQEELENEDDDADDRPRGSGSFGLPAPPSTPPPGYHDPGYATTRKALCLSPREAIQ